MDSFWIIFTTMFFVFVPPLIFVIFYFWKIYKPLEKARIGTPQQVIIKEVVMVPCVYCQGLMPNTSAFCPSCGAPRKI